MDPCALFSNRTTIGSASAGEIRMNLPNYFLADLPPDATLSPAMVASACDTLKRNREKFLSSRSTDEIVKVLCAVAAEWLQPQNQFRKLALELGPEQTGFSRPILEKGLDSFFGQFTPENFESLLRQDLGDGDTSHFWHG